MKTLFPGLREAVYAEGMKLVGKRGLIVLLIILSLAGCSSMGPRFSAEPLQPDPYCRGLADV